MKDSVKPMLPQMLKRGSKSKPKKSQKRGCKEFVTSCKIFKFARKNSKMSIKLVTVT